MTIKAVTPVPPRIDQDIKENGARNLRLFLENVRERLNALNGSVTALSSTTNNTTVVSSSTSDSIVYAIALGGP